MKHAGPQALERLDRLLSALRQLPALREQKPGIFYRRSRAFLHFHEDPAGLFADVRLTDDFERFEVTSEAQQQLLLQQVRDAVS